MKILFIALFGFLFCQPTNAQKKVQSLPTGTYETYFYGFDYNLNKWLRGDIILLKGNKYRLSEENTIGEYQFDAQKQRVYFLSGPLKNVFATTAISSKLPAIVLPKKENKAKKIELAVSDVWAYYKK